MRHRDRHHRRQSTPQDIPDRAGRRARRLLAVYIALAGGRSACAILRASFAGLSDPQGAVLTDSRAGRSLQAAFFRLRTVPGCVPGRAHQDSRRHEHARTRRQPADAVIRDAGLGSRQPPGPWRATPPPSTRASSDWSGDSQHLDALTRAMRICARHADSNDIAQFDHSAQIYLLAPDNSVLASTPRTKPPSAWRPTSRGA